MTLKRATITLLLGLMVLAALGIYILAVGHETPNSNSYVLLADAFLHGRLDVPRCLDDDCALFQGRAYVVFPPLPALLILPFVAIFGTDFHFFLPLTLVAFGLIAWLWWRIAETLIDGRDLRRLYLLLILFATPLLYVLMRGDKIWFFAQIWGFLFASAAIYFAMIDKRPLLAGLVIACAFLCRQMSILYLPFLYVLLLDEETPWFRVDGAAVKRVLALAAFPIAAIVLYMAYNAARFGSPFETGYRFLFPISMDGPGDPGFIKHRMREIGAFSTDYFAFNLAYMFFQGPHLEFVGRYLTELRSFDSNGASLFLVTPSLLFAFLARWDRLFWFGLATCGAILGITLFYHSNGFSQYSAQRYALDWMPILLIFLALGLKRDYVPPLSLLVAYSMAVTIAMIAMGGLLAG